MRVIEPSALGTAKDPDAFVRERGVDAFSKLVAHAGCGVTWHALELTEAISPNDAATSRRAALARAGTWLGRLPARLSLEQEDAIRHVAERCGYSTVAVERAFRARFWTREHEPARAGGRGIEREWQR